ncbi:MAG: metal ABC transporter permease [Chlamydiales bacterium]|nr:metal ABC transporter permease [Chlamydiales bacterium]
MQSIIQLFLDPVFQAPTIAGILMCISSGLVGVIVLLRKKVLLGEALSHAAYPGVVLAAWAGAFFFSSMQEFFPVLFLASAFVTAFLGLWAIELLERKLSIRNDAALCFVLSVFFGLGVLFASRLQITYPLSYQAAQIFLYGQAATLVNVHIVVYSILMLLTVAALAIFYRQIASVIFDRSFAKSIGIQVSLVDALLFILLILAIVIGIRSVGVVLMVGMLVAPSVAARQWTERFSVMLVLSGLFGGISGFLGNYFSIQIPQWAMEQGWNWRFSLPTGPMILLSASCIAGISLLFAPGRGIFARSRRIFAFRLQCFVENLLKHCWKQGEGKTVCIGHFDTGSLISRLQMRLAIWHLIRQGWMQRRGKGCFVLTQDGKCKAEKIVRLHRLWEVYLVHLGHKVEKVHRSAEEMEHILTPELEKELTDLLKDPSYDPHEQPIPRRKEFLT